MSEQRRLFEFGGGPYAFDPDRKIRSLGGSGILRPSDLPALSAAAERIELLMRDGQWHSAEQIIHVARQREGLRRMRELRGQGYDIQVRRVGDGRSFDYRAVKRDCF